MKHLHHAEKTSPTSVRVYQYQANVAFLMGDRERARRALERALELEPDNARFRRNLGSLDR